ncbi:BglG family transcription antiterminator [Convivina praedatoris]|uniref:Transcriptional antiterminator n=1 Tax=Convivina praedatoris TaxID=2880963 RepID=A0ABN8HCY8_9LACO|nr:transcriptional antiterminator [Convivina sp. LMG 32447]CAH1852235.1 hypothetical protein R077815_00523 [Convivina sp. LMG 32447]CAH1853685.1 hypothetical protein R078138_00707 [Convivina sp. LMG 32447]CAH1854379.1 hypothetical protein LMG032447_00855 [Convivina sp. LMG 32447]
MQLTDLVYSNFIGYLATQIKLPRVSIISNQLNLSNRKVYSLLQKANLELKSSHQTFLATGQEISKDQITILQRKLLKYPVTDSINSYQRQLMIDICMSLPNQKWTISKFQMVFEVSRNTILRDIAKLKERKNFSPVFNKKDGFTYSESIYSLLVHAYNKLVLLQHQHGSLAYFVSTLYDDVNYQDYLSMSEGLQKEYQKLLGKTISGASALTLSVFIVLASLYETAHPIQSPDEIFNSQDIQALTSRQEFNVIQQFMPIVTQVTESNISESLQLFLTLQLLSLTKEHDGHFNAQSFQDLLILSEQIVDSFLAMSGTDINNNRVEKNQLVREIQTQLKPFWFATRFQSVNVHEYLYHESHFEKYVQEALTQEKSLNLYHSLFPMGLSNDQITILAMILYNYNLNHRPIKKLNLLILTSLPVYSQNLIKAFIEKCTLVPVNLTLKSLNNYDYITNYVESYDLIITESMEIKLNSPTFLIGNELTNRELNRLKNVLSQIYLTEA